MAALTCPWCAPAVVLHSHCDAEKGCPAGWLRCRKCGAVIDPAAKRANRDGKPLAWPEAKR